MAQHIALQSRLPHLPLLDQLPGDATRMLACSAADLFLQQHATWPKARCTDEA